MAVTKYTVHTFNKELGGVSADEKLKLLHELEDKIKNGDPRLQ